MENLKQQKQKAGFYFGNANKTPPAATGYASSPTGVEGQELPPPRILFEHFMKDITRMNVNVVGGIGGNGSYGTILILEFKPEILDKITDDTLFLRDNLAKPCRRLLLKLCYVNTSEKEMWAGDKRSVGRQHFENEVNIQNKVFIETNSELQPITPLIYFSHIYSNRTQEFAGKGGEKTDFINRLKVMAQDKELEKRIQTMQELTDEKKLDIGAIFMEMRDGFESAADSPVDRRALTTTKGQPPFSGLRRLVSPREQKLLVSMMGEVLNRLHNCNITHGDLHQENMLVNLSDPDSYYGDNRPNILLIDWGRAIDWSTKTKSIMFGVDSSLVPSNDAFIEHGTAETGPHGEDWWSYQWLKEPIWSLPEVKEQCLELRRTRLQKTQFLLTKNVNYLFQTPYEGLREQAPGSHNFWGRDPATFFSAAAAAAKHAAAALGSAADTAAGAEVGAEAAVSTFKGGKQMKKTEKLKTKSKKQNRKNKIGKTKSKKQNRKNKFFKYF
jgi:hypothetical protein